MPFGINVGHRGGEGGIEVDTPHSARRSLRLAVSVAAIAAGAYRPRMASPQRPTRQATNEGSPKGGAGAEETYRVGWRMAGLGWEFVSHVLAGMLLGWGVDWYWNTRPWGIAIGAGAGLAVGTLQFVRTAYKLNASLGPVNRPPGGWKKVEPEDEKDDDGAGDEDNEPGASRS